MRTKARSTRSSTEGGKEVGWLPAPSVQKRTVLERALKSPFVKGDLGGFSEKGAYVFKIPPDPFRKDEG